MVIQYLYALLTMLPCPIWFWYRWASAAFLMAIFTWATYNGATFYIDVFGKRMEKELESMRKEVAKWQNTPEGRTIVDAAPAGGAEGGDGGNKAGKDGKADHSRSKSVDDIPPLDQKDQKVEGSSTGTEAKESDTVRQR